MTVTVGTPRGSRNGKDEEMKSRRNGKRRCSGQTAERKVGAEGAGGSVDEEGIMAQGGAKTTVRLTTRVEPRLPILCQNFLRNLPSAAQARNIEYANEKETQMLVKNEWNEGQRSSDARTLLWDDVQEQR